jgi:hypothetical protein
MNYVQKIRDRIIAIDPGQSEFNLAVRANRITVKSDVWQPDLHPSESFVDYIVADGGLNRAFNRETREWYIEGEFAIDRANSFLLRNAKSAFISCSPAKAPRRTKLWKSFLRLLEKNKHNVDFMNSLYDIEEYRWSVTKTESIGASSNDVHRKNIFQLLTLMEKNYGKTGT